MIAVPLLVLLAQTPTTPAQGPSPAAAARPVVVLDTSLGTIKIALDRDKAPASVDNFLQYVRAGHFDGTIFHRVIPGFMIQGGGFDSGMKQKATRPPVRNEARGGLRNRRGTVAMARTNDPDSATAQFFINVKDNSMLDYGPQNPGYAVIGEVVDGMGVVDRIVAVPTTTRAPHSDVPVTPVVIKSAKEAGGAAPGKAATSQVPNKAPRATPRTAAGSASPLDQAQVAFVGEHTRPQIKERLDRALQLYGLPLTDENYSRAGSTLVALRQANGTPEMDILDHMIRSHVAGVKLTFPEAAGLSSSFLKAGDK